jgi:hypothetical protein
MGTALDRCKRFDSYGVEFAMNYRGKETFKTCHGGCFSILVVLFVLNYTTANFYRMYFRKHPEVFTHFEPMSPQEIEETGIISLAKKRLNVAI